MCDGAVRFICENIDSRNVVGPGWANNGHTNTALNGNHFAQMGVYQLLGIRADDRPVGDF